MLVRINHLDPRSRFVQAVVEVFGRGVRRSRQRQKGASTHYLQHSGSAHLASFRNEPPPGTHLPERTAPVAALACCERVEVHFGVDRDRGVGRRSRISHPAGCVLRFEEQGLRNRDFEVHEAVSLAPKRTDIRKDLAYTYLKIGETELARDRFEEAMRLDPDDTHVALEYAFLCYETKQQAAARRVFDRIRRSGNATAERAFQNIDGELRSGIERWSHAVETQPENFSAHEELARLAEWRDDLGTAAAHYERAWRLRPERRDLLLRLGDVWRAARRRREGERRATCGFSRR